MCKSPSKSSVHKMDLKMKSKKVIKRRVVSDGIRNDDRVSVRLTPRQYFEMKEICKANNLRMSSLIRELVQRFLDRINGDE